MRKSLVLSLTLLAASATLGCASIPAPISGSGTPATEERAVGAFSELLVGQAISATVTAGGPQVVRVTADDNVLARVETTLVGNRLEISMRGAVTTRTPVSVEIVAPSPMTQITANSAARITAAGIEVDLLTVNANSAGVVDASGRATSLRLSAQSAGVANLGQLAVESVIANLDSAGLATINTSGTVTGHVGSAAVLTVTGAPTSVEVATDSLGQVVQP